MSNQNNGGGPPKAGESKRSGQALQHPTQLPDASQLFGSDNVQQVPQHLLQTPSKAYAAMSSATKAQLIETVPLNTTGPSPPKHSSMGSAIQGANVQSPNSQGTRTLLASAYRADEPSVPAQANKTQQPTLVPNFWSISPSIFNIDLNQTADQQQQNLNQRPRPMTQGASQGQPGPVSPNSASNHIYVSIHSKRNQDTSHRKDVVSPKGATRTTHGAYQSANRIKRVGPINRGDKIKFGVIVPRETKPKNQNSDIDHLSRHEIFETPKSLVRQGQVAVGQHSEAVYRIMTKYQTYTTRKTLPTALFNQHQNIIKQFQTNFTKETKAFSKHKLMSASASQGPQGYGGAALSTTIGGGYLTEDDTRQQTLRSQAQRLGARTRLAGHQSAAKPGRPDWLSEDGCLMNVRDVIEEHAKSVAALNKSYRPNMHLEIDEQRKRRNKELEAKGKAIANKMNISVHSCCTRVARLYRGLTDEQPLRQHNKPLSHMMRPSDKIRMERKKHDEEEDRKRAASEKARLKNKMIDFSYNSMKRDFKGGLSAEKRGKRLTKEEKKSQKELLEKFRKDKMGYGSREDWDNQRKQLEDKIDNGMTFSHLSRYYPMKREWAKFLVLIRKRDKERVRKDRKIKEIKEDLHEKGIVDQKIVANEIDMFEYQEFKKRRDRSKARMGAKAEAKYYRPVDTERTLKIEKISMNFSDDYDDGPGNFQIEDFAGVETMFSKQSLEQRRLRVDRARDRLREKRLRKMNEMKRQKEEELRLAELEAIRLREEQGITIGSSQEQVKSERRLSVPNQIMTKSLESKDAKLITDARQIIRPDSCNTDVPQDKQLRSSIEDSISSAALAGKGKNRPPRVPKTHATLTATQQKSMPVPGTVIESQEGSIMSNSIEGQRVRDTHPDAELYSKKSGAIRVEIASSNALRNPKRDAVKTSSQIRDFSLEDGGIFEKKTIVNNSSVEEAKLGDSLTQRTQELMAGTQSLSEEPVEDQSVQQPPDSRAINKKLSKFSPTRHQKIARDAQNAYQNAEEQELTVNEDYRGQPSPPPAQQINVQAPMAGYIQANAEMPMQRMRPSTTENIRRNIIRNRRRQLMSGQNVLQGLRASAAQAEHQRLGRYTSNYANEKSIGVITTVQQQQYQESAALNAFQSGKLAVTNSSGFPAETRPSNQIYSQAELGQKLQTGAITLAESGLENAHTGTQYFDKRSVTNVHSKLSMDRSLNETHSAPRVTIWKELMKQKEEEGLDGNERLSRSTMKVIRNKIRRERAKMRRKQRKMLQRKRTSLAMLDASNMNVNAMMMQSQAGLSPDRTQFIDQQNRMRSISSGKTEPRTLSNNPGSGDASLTRIGLNQRPLAGNANNIQAVAQRLQLAELKLGPVRGLYATQQADRYRENQSSSSPNRTTTIEQGASSTPTGGQHTGPMSNQTPNEQAMAIRVQGGAGLEQNQDDGAQRSSFVLGGINGALGDPIGGEHSMNDSDHIGKDFLEFNRTFVKENALKQRFSSQFGRMRQMRNIRRNDSIYQIKLTENRNRSTLMTNQKRNLGIKQKLSNVPLSLQRLRPSGQRSLSRGHFTTGFSTSQMYPTFQDTIMDRRSMKVFKQNQLQVDPDVQNHFSRNQAWNETLNCPYYGLMSLRDTQDKPINASSRQENILRPFTTGNWRERMHISKVKRAIKNRNQLREMDRQIYGLIEMCQSSSKIEWKHIYDEHEDFRNTQKKKIVENKELSVEELMELSGMPSKLPKLRIAIGQENVDKLMKRKQSPPPKAKSIESPTKRRSKSRKSRPNKMPIESRDCQTVKNCHIPAPAN